MTLLGPGGYPMPIPGVGQASSGAVNMLSQLPTNPIYNTALNTARPFVGAGRSVAGLFPEGAAAAEDIGGVGGASSSLLSRIPFLGNSMSGLAPWAENASFGSKIAGVGTALLPTFAGQLGGNLYANLFGGNATLDKSNPAAQFGRGFLKGAGAGGTIGLLGGPFDPITVPVGIGVGGVVGGLADALNVSDWFKSNDNTVKNYNKAQTGFNTLLAQTLGNDEASRSYINRQLGFQASILTADPSLSDKDKAKALQGLIGQGQQMLGQYVANPYSFRQQAVQAMGGSAGANGMPSAMDQLAMQAAIAKYTNPIADQIEATGKQQAAIYGERGGQIGGERGNALSYQGSALALGAKQVADAYRAQAQLMPTKYLYDQYGVIQPTGHSSPTTFSQQQLSAGSVGSGFPTSSSGGGGGSAASPYIQSAQPSSPQTNSKMDQLLSQFNQNSYNSIGGGGGLPLG